MWFLEDFKAEITFEDKTPLTPLVVEIKDETNTVVRTVDVSPILSDIKINVSPIIQVIMLGMLVYIIFGFWLRQFRGIKS